MEDEYGSACTLSTLSTEKKARVVDEEDCRSRKLKCSEEGLVDLKNEERWAKSDVSNVTMEFVGSEMEFVCSEIDSFPCCLTPVEGVFDPFAPCEEEQAVFRRRKTVMVKMMPKLPMEPLCRRLNFDLCSSDDNDHHHHRVVNHPQLQLMDVDSSNIMVEKGLQESSSSSAAAADGDDILEEEEEEEEEEEKFLEFTYKLVVDAILTAQQLELKTPTSLQFQSGVAETCPGPPVRPTAKSRKFSKNICRKLEF